MMRVNDKDDLNIDESYNKSCDKEQCESVDSRESNGERNCIQNGPVTDSMNNTSGNYCDDPNSAADNEDAAGSTDGTANEDNCCDVNVGRVENGNNKTNNLFSNLDDDIYNVLKLKDTLDDAQKYAVLKKNYSIEEKYVFPIEIDGRKKRQFRRVWCQQYKWLVYSKNAAGALCKYCVLFATDKSILNLVNKAKTRKWKNAPSEFRTHHHSPLHTNCHSLADRFISIYENKQDSFEHILSKQLKQDSIRIRNGLLSITKALVLCARQNLAIRGHSDNSVLKFENGKHIKKNNCNKLGNLNSLLLFRIESGDNLLKEHLEKSNRNAIHTTDKAQNDLLEICGSQIQNQIISEIQAAKYFSILADESADIANHEQFALCIRYVYNNCVYTQFMEFVSVKNTCGVFLADVILNKLKSWNLNVNKLRGQCYDGASNMSGKFEGVQAHIRGIEPTAIYTHCVAHALNLVVVDSFDNSYIKDAISTVKSVIKFFRESVQRNNVFENHLRNDSAHKKLHSLCETRWTDRAYAIRIFIQLLPTVYEALESITESRDCNSATKTDARSLLLSISQCGFLFGLLLANDILDQLSNLTKYLQTANIDVNEAYSYIKTVITRLKQQRNQVDEYFSEIYINVVDLCSVFNIELKLPRLVGKQNHRNNVPAETVEEYYRRAIAIPLLDHVISSLSDRFNDETKASFKLRHLLAENIIKFDKNEEMKRLSVELSDFYTDDLSGVNLYNELILWKQKWIDTSKDTLPKCAIENLSNCNEDLFPGINKLLTILCVLPITTVDCERCFSSLNLILSYLRSTMNQDRINSLALIYIDKNRDVDVEKVVDTFINTGKHRV